MLINSPNVPPIFVNISKKSLLILLLNTSDKKSDNSGVNVDISTDFPFYSLGTTFTFPLSALTSKLTSELFIFIVVEFPSPKSFIVNVLNDCGNSAL